jgi:hypothetical protein
MKYYEIIYESDPKIVGVKDGAGQAGIDAKFLSNHSWFQAIFYKNESWTPDWWKKWANITQYGRDLHEITMEKKAKHTDYIKFPRFMRGFIVNDRLKAILEGSRLPNHEFYKASFNQAGKIIEGYWWFCFDMDDGSKTVDFSISKFEIEKHNEKYGTNHVIRNYEDYLQVFYDTGSAVKATSLCFNSNFDKELDVFGTQFLSSAEYVSERLVNKFEENKIAGYSIREPRCELKFS